MANKVLNFNKPLFDLAGEPIAPVNGKEQTVGAWLAPALSGHNQGDPLKYFAWAVSMYNGGDLNLDESDLSVLKEFIKTATTLSNLVKAQALQIINE
jgi:hypothetical protein